jgi:hypothetical protein
MWGKAASAFCPSWVEFQTNYQEVGFSQMSSLEPTQCLIIEMCQLLISSKFELLEG